MSGVQVVMEFLPTEKSKPKLCVDGFFYYKDKVCGENVHWACQHKQRVKCPARVTTNGECIVKKWKDHNHCADAAEVEATRVLKDIKECAALTKTPGNELFKNAVETCSRAAAARLPTVDNIKRTIRNIRQRKEGGPALPASRSEIFFSGEFTTTAKGEKFLLYDSGPTENRLLIFGTRQNLMLLAKSKHWYADGTFKTVPLLFAQLYTIHGFKDKLSIPLVSTILQNHYKACKQKTLKNLGLV